MNRPATDKIRATSDSWWTLWGRWLVVVLLSITTGLAIPAFRAARAIDQRVTAVENYQRFVVIPFVKTGDRFTQAHGETLKQEILLAVEQSMAEHVRAGPHGDVAERLDRIERLLLERLPRKPPGSPK